MDELINRASLERREAALAFRLCLGVLQNTSLMDFYIDNFSSIKAKKLEPKVRDILHLGIYQLLYTDIPSRAAVNESVALCKSSGYSRASGLVNAVLRRISENAGNLPEPGMPGTAEHLSVKYSHSQWLIQRLIREQGYERTEAFLASNNRPAPLTVQINTLKISVGAYISMLEKAGISFDVHPWLEGCVILGGGSVNTLPGFEEGLFYVQDAAARAAVEIAAPETGMCVLDACSAPGGKSFASAIRMGNQGSIISSDIHEKKLRLIKNGAQRLGINIISTRCADARCIAPDMEELYDLVIADVPCSGFGVIAKKPEIRWKKEEDIAAIPGIQLDILKSLAQRVRPGGTLLYSTCTVLHAENESLVSAFLDIRKDYRLEPFSLGAISAPDGMYGFWPDRDGTDGFFAAKLKRIDNG